MISGVMLEKNLIGKLTIGKISRPQGLSYPSHTEYPGRSVLACPG